MTGPKFTPGPWRVSKKKARRVTSEHGVVICNAVLRNQGGPKQKALLKNEHEAEANADLIAAAPDLLAALEEAQAVIHGEFCTSERCQCGDMLAAIAKAKGLRHD